MHIVQQLWKDVSYEIAVNIPSPTWWTNTGTQKTVICNDHMGNEGGHFENVLSGCSNSENMLQNVYVRNFLSYYKEERNILKTIKRKKTNSIG